MKRPLTALVAAFSLIASGSIAPVQARGHDNNILPFVLGAAAIGLLLSQQNAHGQPLQRRDDHDGWRRRDARIVPAECLVRLDGYSGPREAVSGRCMADRGMARRLPDECAFDVRGRSGRRSTVYGERCLRDRGFRIEDGRY